MKGFKNYAKLRVLTEEGQIANGDYILEEVTVRLKNGFLNDSLDEDGNILPAIESHDGNHIEHWNNGMLNCDNEPAFIDIRDNIEEWWSNGIKVESKE